MSGIQKTRYTLIILAIVMIGMNFSNLDFNNLSWSENKGAYSGLISMFLLILSMILSIRHETNQIKKNKNED